jgi:hypothetical protein
MTTTTPADLTAALALEGFTPGTPPGLAAAARAVDEACAAEYECFRCGRLACEYRPFHRGRRYRAFARCVACGWAEEF